MAYYIVTTDAGMTREVEKWKCATKEEKRKISRGAKSNPTNDAQTKVNRNRALRSLVCLVNANFKAGDYWLTLTYAREFCPDDNDCKADYKRFMRKLRLLYKKAGMPLKYIATCNEPGHRPHIHILCSKGVELEKISALWEYGRMGIKFLDSSGQYRKLAEYIFKHGEKGKRSWLPSKKLIHPKAKQKQVNAKHWREEPTAPKGFMIDKTSPIERGINPVTGAEYLRYTLIRLENVEKCRKSVPCARTRDNYRQLKEANR